MKENNNEIYCHFIPTEKFEKILNFVNKYDFMFCKASIAEFMTSSHERFFSRFKNSFRKNKYLLSHQKQQNQKCHDTFQGYLRVFV